MEAGRDADTNAETDTNTTADADTDADANANTDTDAATTPADRGRSHALLYADPVRPVMSHQRVAVRCPACSPGSETAHEVLNRGGQATVRCSDCGRVHKTTIETETTVERRVIVSQEGDSEEAFVEIPPDEELSTGDEFLVETETALLTARITSLETTDGARVETAVAADLKTLWTRAVGNVAVNLTLHPKDGGHDETRSVKLQVPGDESFVVGETHEFGGEEFTVERLLVREDATGYDRTGYDHPGDGVPAKDLKRAYARDEDARSRAWSGW